MATNTQLSDREKANKWWDDMQPVERTYFENKHFPDYDPEKDSPFLSNEQVLHIWITETQQPPPTVKEGEEGFTKGEWELVLGRHKEGTPIYGWGIRVAGKAAYLTLQGLCESANSVGMGFDGNPHPQLFTPEEAEANAHLIAASKKMYAHIKKIVNSAQPSLIMDWLEEAKLILKEANPKLP